VIFSERGKIRLISREIIFQESNLYDHVTSTLQTDGQTDGQLAIWHLWARTRGAQLSAGDTVNTHKMVARYALPSAFLLLLRRSIYSVERADRHGQTRDRHDLPYGQSDSTQLKAWKYRALRSIAR